MKTRYVIILSEGIYHKLPVEVPFARPSFEMMVGLETILRDLGLHTGENLVHRKLRAQIWPRIDKAVLFSDSYRTEAAVGLGDIVESRLLGSTKYRSVE